MNDWTIENIVIKFMCITEETGNLNVISVRINDRDDAVIIKYG